MEDLSSKFKEIFRPDVCDECGICFSRCPELHLPEGEAKAEIRRLMQGESKHVLWRCTSCFSCDTYCPRGCLPYELILACWNDLHQRRGAPPITRMVLPNEEPNLWSALEVLLPEDERRTLQAWAAQTPIEDEEILLTGCFTNLIPYISYTGLLTDLVPIGTPDLWCSGGHIYQLGWLRAVEQIGRRVQHSLAGVKKVVTFMGAEYTMLSHILPRQFGIEFDFEVQPLMDWLWSRIEGGGIALTNQLGQRVTVHDNCFSKAEGDRFFDLARRLVEATGCEVVEMVHSREDALCCGFGAGASYVHPINIPFDIVAGGIRRIREAEETGAEALVVHCSACLFILSMAREICGSRMSIYHVLELVQLASGEEPVHRHRERAWQIIAAVTYQFLHSLFQRSFQIKDIPPQIEEGKAKRRYALLKAIHLALRSRLVRWLYVSGFRSILAARSLLVRRGGAK